MTKAKRIEYHQLNALKKAAMKRGRIVVILHTGETHMGEAVFVDDEVVNILDEYSGDEYQFTHDKIYATATVSRFSATF